MKTPSSYMSLFIMLLPGQRWFDVEDFGTEAGSRKIVALEQEKQIVQKLHEILKPFLLRRLKTDVEFSIPPKREMILFAPLAKKVRLKPCRRDTWSVPSCLT